jgi:hypothetical protein
MRDRRKNRMMWRLRRHRSIPGNRGDALKMYYDEACLFEQQSGIFPFVRFGITMMTIDTTGKEQHKAVI